MDNWHNLKGLESQAQRIKKQATAVLLEVKTELEGSGLNGFGARLVLQDDERVLAQLLTPISESRIRMDWRRTADLGVEGVLVLEQKRYDSRDRPFWTPTFEFLVPTHGGPYMEKDGDRVSWALGGTEARGASEEIFAIGVYLTYHATRSV